jgi:competence protein ComGC
MDIKNVTMVVLSIGLLIFAISNTIQTHMINNQAEQIRMLDARVTLYQSRADSITAFLKGSRVWYFVPEKDEK